MNTLTRYLAVAAGGALGACLRFYVGGSLLSRAVAPFPTATFVINVTGSFILGFFLTLAAERIEVDWHLRLAVAVGFVGAYTTFSTFEYETAILAEEGNLALALLNVVLSFAVGYAAAWAGIAAARRVEGIPITSNATYEQFERRADARDPTQAAGAERDIRDASIGAHKEADERQRPSSPPVGKA